MTRWTKRTRRVLAGAALLLAATLVACGGDSQEPAPHAEKSGEQAGAPSGAGGLLAEHGLDGLEVAEVIDRLDSLPVADRPADLIASVRPGELVVSTGAEEQSLPIAGDRFYLSVAPYVDSTHDCFHHSLTTCQGELAGAEVEVRIVEETTGEVLVEETRTTFDNGFTGFWLPRDIEATLRITYDGRTGEVPITTDEDAPTCLTTLQLT